MGQVFAACDRDGNGSMAREEYMEMLGDEVKGKTLFQMEAVCKREMHTVGKTAVRVEEELHTVEENGELYHEDICGILAELTELEDPKSEEVPPLVPPRLETSPEQLASPASD